MVGVPYCSFHGDVNANATVTICHSRTQNLECRVKEADLVVGAVGIPNFIQRNWLKHNVIVIDAGYHPQQCGDVDLEGIENIASFHTPVPGGVGPMTINTLILQTLRAAVVFRIFEGFTDSLSS